MQTYRRFFPGTPKPGALVIKFYHSGGQVRGFVREVAKPGEEDAIFPGEEMQPHAAFEIAHSHAKADGQPIYVELTEDVEWDPAWGTLEY